MIPFSAPLLPATFLRRDNRFRAALLLGDTEVATHVPNSGRLGELLRPGACCWTSPAATPGRKTSHDLRLVHYNGELVSIDARLPNHLFADALASGRMLPFSGCTLVRPEVTLGKSRLDFLLADPAGQRLWVETKSVTLVEEGVALFPDAPTLRGQKHLAELSAAVAAGDRAAVIFVVQRGDAGEFMPHPDADPAFGAALAAAAQTGVAVVAFRCDVTMAGVQIADEIPICL